MGAVGAVGDDAEALLVALRCNAARRVGPVHAYLPLTINGEVDL